MVGRDHWLAVVAVLVLVGCHDTVGPVPIEIDPEFNESGGLASIAHPYRADALDRLRATWMECDLGARTSLLA